MMKRRQVLGRVDMRKLHHAQYENIAQLSPLEHFVQYRTSAATFPLTKKRTALHGVSAMHDSVRIGRCHHRHQALVA